MAEEIKVGTVTWVKLSPDADGTLVLRLVEKADEGVAMTLDPVVYELNRSHVLFSTMESTFFSALLHGFDLAITAEGSRVVAASIAGRQLPLETPSELRQRVAAGPTQEALGALARGFKSTTKRAARWRRRSSVSINLNTGPLDRGALRTPAAPS